MCEKGNGREGGGGGGGGGRGGSYHQSDSHYSSSQDIASQDNTNKYSSSDSLQRAGGGGHSIRGYRGSQSDMGRVNSNNRPRNINSNNRYNDNRFGQDERSGSYGKDNQQDRYNSTRRNSGAQQYNNNRYPTKHPSQDHQAQQSGTGEHYESNDPPPPDTYENYAPSTQDNVNQLSEQLNSTHLSESEQRNTQRSDSITEDTTADTSEGGQGGVNWSGLDWTEDVDEDLWVAATGTNEQDTGRSDHPSPPSESYSTSSKQYSPPPPSTTPSAPTHSHPGGTHTSDNTQSTADKDWRGGGRGLTDSESNSSGWSSRQNQNWGRQSTRGGRDDLNDRDRGGSYYRNQQQQQQNYNSSSRDQYLDYNDRYGEPKRKPYNSNSNTLPSINRGGRNQFQNSYRDEVPPRFRKKQEEGTNNNHQQHHQRSNPQPPSSYSSRQPPPGPSSESSYHSIGTYSDCQWSGEPLEVRGQYPRHHQYQDSNQFNSLPPPGKSNRYNEGPPRGDYRGAGGRRYSTYETDSSEYTHQGRSTSTLELDQQPQSLPASVNTAATTTGKQHSEEKVKFSWSEEVEHEAKLEKLQSALQVPDSTSHHRVGGDRDRRGGGGGGGRGRGMGGERERAARGGGFGGGGGQRRERDGDRDRGFDKHSRSSSRSRRRRRKSGSSQGSRRRSISRDTVDTNMSSTTNRSTRSRKNSDRSSVTSDNWRDRAQHYEHSRSSEVANWRERSNPTTTTTSSSNSDTRNRAAVLKSSSSTSSSGRDKDPPLSWRQPPPQIISEEPGPPQTGPRHSPGPSSHSCTPPSHPLPPSPSPSPAGLIKIPSQDSPLLCYPNPNQSYPSSQSGYGPSKDYPNQSSANYASSSSSRNANAYVSSEYPNSSRTPQLYNPHNPAHPIPVHSSQVRPPAPCASSPNASSNRIEYLTVNGQLLLPPPESNAQTAIGSALPKQWYAKDMLTKHPRGKHLLTCVQANNEIVSILNTPGWIVNYERISTLRASIKDVLQWFVTSDMKFAQVENVETHLWKLAFYNVIEAVRNYPSQELSLKQLLNDIIEDSISYFEKLIVSIQERYKLDIDNFMEADVCSVKSTTGYALQCALKICIFLGDLCRYKVTFCKSTNYCLANAWYTKANQLNPRHGRPFHQLGLIAILERRQLDAIYNYARSLLTPNYLRSAHERLITIFDENRKKYETAYSSEQTANNVLLDQKRKETREYRREIWVHPEDNRSTRRNQLINDSDTAIEAEAFEKLAALEHVELTKQFTCSFLMVHGKLFSKTGLDTLTLISKQMLREFKLLLSQNGLNNRKLLQLLSINMFAIESTQLKDNKLGGENYKSLTQELALIVSLEMFFCLVHQANVLLVDNQPTQDAPITNLFLLNLLPSIKIWCDWFVCQTSIWNPPPSCSDYHIGSGDVWTELASFVNALLAIQFNVESLFVPSPECDELEALGRCVPSKSDDHPVSTEGVVQVRLPEDIMFIGYSPLSLISNIQDPMYTRVTNNLDVVHTCARLKIILFFGTEFLVGIDPPVLKLHKTESGQDEYISIVEIVSKEESDEGSGDEERGSFEFEEEIEETPKATSEAENGSRTSEMLPPDSQQVCFEYQELIAKREILNKQEEQCEMKKRILESHKKIRVQLEIRPHYLVPDTNCFIDYLSELKGLAHKKMVNQSAAVLKRNVFTILIPCIVYNELINISKSVKKSVQVVQNAKKALQFIQSETTSFKYVTTKGTFLSKKTFSMEEDDLLLKNDDKILETCVSLAKKNASAKKPHAFDKSAVESVRALGNPAVGDGLEIIFRDVVLLTEDRNLRLKALARDMPVTNINNFTKWYNVRPSS
uniref:Telomerase-binding protein EST1A n=1 Tax=Cacopsylla melanoneura TaxID=428564 RepID=A0A8D8US36_9HEMI